jgi:hypothetical protein
VDKQKEDHNINNTSLDNNNDNSKKNESDLEESYHTSKSSSEQIEQIKKSKKYRPSEVEIRWSQVGLVGSILGLVIVGLNFLFFLILKINRPYVFIYLPWAFFLECGLLLTFGGCVGTVKQSITIDRIRKKLSKGENVNWIDTKIALGSAYTYILAGVILAIASFIAWTLMW